MNRNAEPGPRNRSRGLFNFQRSGANSLHVGGTTHSPPVSIGNADDCGRMEAGQRPTRSLLPKMLSTPLHPRRRMAGAKRFTIFFGGSKGRELPMHMTWHNPVFDADQQIGVGEYTFRYRIQTHGIVIVKIEHGLITHWREYEVESNLPWEQFTAKNRF